MAENAPLSGQIPIGTGLASVVRIPIPGMSGLCIEFRPRGYVPPSGSTSTLFIQDATGRRHLRLDYGYNVRTQTIDYHWNQKGTHPQFNITDHSPAGKYANAAYKAAKYFRYAGRVLVIVGGTLDAISIVQSSKPLRRASQVVVAWAAAWVGCKLVGAAGAVAGTAAAPGPGTAAGGVLGCIVGGVAGYAGGQAAGGEVYDWAEDTFFTPLAETQPSS